MAGDRARTNPRQVPWDSQFSAWSQKSPALDPWLAFPSCFLQATHRSVSSLCHLAFIISCGHSREGDGGRVGDKRLCPGLDRDTRSIPHWRGDQSIP